MNPPERANELQEAVIFDLGGVLARICHTWEDAAEGAGIPHRLGAGHTPLTSFLSFDQYQAGQLPLDEYLQDLGAFLGCTADEALEAHNGILVDEYPGVAQLVRELESKGLRTGCLSNTNEEHWALLTRHRRFHTISTLELKMASHLVGLNKPNPAIFRAFEHQFSLVPEQIVYFDDHAGNVDSAIDCGWRASLIDPAGDTVSQIRAHLSRLGVLEARPIA